MQMQKTDGSGGFIMSLWNIYSSFVERRTKGKTNVDDITDWRSTQFTNFITYLIPICFIALVPGVYFGFKYGYIFIAAFDVVAAAALFTVVLSTRLNLQFRKFFVISVLYALAIMLIFNIGMLGPGLLYLFAISIFIVLTFPTSFAYWSVFINFIICASFTLIIYWRSFNIPLTTEYDLGAWIAVCSNLLFLGSVSVFLIGRALNQLENVVLRESALKIVLVKKNVEIQRNSELIKESETQFKSLFFHGPSPMWLLDSQTLQFLQVNEAAVEKYGYSNDEFLSMNVAQIKLEKDVEAIRPDIEKSKQSETPLRLITQHRKKNEETIYVEVIFSPILFDGKDASLVVAQDISEQIAYIKAIENQNAILREIAWMQSHELRGPLSTIMGIVELYSSDISAIPTEKMIAGLLSTTKKLDVVIRAIVDKASLPVVGAPVGRYSNLTI